MTPPVKSGKHQVATGTHLRQALLAASSWLDTQVDHINGLNVFPVPDGDTGTNMSLTLRAAADAVRTLPDSAGVGEVAWAAYQAAMMGARGNSGVILSQLLRGFAHALDGHQEMTPDLLGNALAEASSVAYRGVSRPVEGTILTVARKVGEAANAAARLGEDLVQLLDYAVRAAGEAVAETPKQLDVLRKAGVVDSGGEGYRVVLEGAWMWASGHEIQPASHADEPSGPAFEHLDSDAEPFFGFCTEYLLRDCTAPLDEIKRAMESLGDSVIAVGEPDLVRVHVHTERPGRALEFAVDHGTLARVKIENMSLQHQEFVAQKTATHQPSAVEEAIPELGQIGLIAVAAGDGFQEVFRSFGATVVEGGQTMNPSVQEILNAVNALDRQDVIILPNNSNIILTARHVMEMTTRSVRVVPTETAPQGIAALLAFNFQADLETNASEMERAASHVHTVEVTRAVRDAEIDYLQVRNGQLMGIYDGKVVATAPTQTEAAIGAFEHAPDSLELVTIYYGEGASQVDADDLATRIAQTRPGIQTDVVAGGQPHYPFILSLE